MNSELRFLKGNKEKFITLPNKSEDNFYITTGVTENDYCLYLGDKLLAKCGSESIAIDEAKKYADSLNKELEKKVAAVDAKTDNEISRSTLEDTNIKNEITKNKVASSDSTLLISSSESGTDAKVNIDNVTIVQKNGVISVSDESLTKYLGKDAVIINDGTDGNKIISLKINSGDSILSQSKGGLLSNLKMVWSSQKGLELIGKNEKVISNVPSSDLIIDGLLETVELIGEGKEAKLIFTFKTNAEGSKPIEVPVADLVDIYLGSNGIEVSNNSISVKIDETADEQYLSASDKGLTTVGIDLAIASSKSEVKTSDTESHIKVDANVSGSNNIYTITSIDVASKSSLDTHLSDSEKHINSDERTKWNKVITDLETEASNRASADSTETTARENSDNAIIGGVGLSSDGSHIKTSGNYTSGATTIAEEIAELDTVLKDNNTKLDNEINSRKGLKGSGNITVFKDTSSTLQTIRLEWGTF